MWVCCVLLGAAAAYCAYRIEMQRKNCTKFQNRLDSLDSELVCIYADIEKFYDVLNRLDKPRKPKAKK